jgi:hypothetical protein
VVDTNRALGLVVSDPVRRAGGRAGDRRRAAGSWGKAELRGEGSLGVRKYEKRDRHVKTDRRAESQHVRMSATPVPTAA